MIARRPVGVSWQNTTCSWPVWSMGTDGLLTSCAGVAGNVGGPVGTCEHLGHGGDLPVRFRILGDAGVSDQRMACPRVTRAT